MKKIMVGILVVVMLLAMSAVSLAQQTVGQVLTIEWNQPGELTGVAGWVLYESDTSGSGYTKALEIPYVEGSGPDFISEQAITFSGAKGSTITKYFILTAKSKDESLEESDPSNEASVSFYIPWGAPASPFSLTVKVKVKVVQ